MALGFGILGLAPDVFWSMTMKELEAAVRGRLGPNTSAEPLRRADLEQLLGRYPDTN